MRKHVVWRLEKKAYRCEWKWNQSMQTYLKVWSTQPPPPFPQVPTHSPVPQGRVGTLALSLGTGDGQKGHSMVVHVRCQSTHAAHWDDEHLPFNY